MAETIDLIARLTERRRLHDRHKEVNDQCTETMSLADFDLCLHALKVQEAAETGVRADERREMQKAVAEAMAWSEHHRLQHDACEWAVKGEQP